MDRASSFYSHIQNSKVVNAFFCRAWGWGQGYWSWHRERSRGKWFCEEHQIKDYHSACCGQSEEECWVYLCLPHVHHTRIVCTVVNSSNAHSFQYAFSSGAQNWNLTTVCASFFEFCESKNSFISFWCTKCWYYCILI